MESLGTRLINVQRTCARGLSTHCVCVCVCVCLCVCVSAIFWLHETFMQHFEHGNRLYAKRKRFSTHKFQDCFSLNMVVINFCTSLY